MRTAALLVALALTSCTHAKTLRYVNAPRFAPTRADDVAVLEAAPAGAIELGEVEGASEGVFGGAMPKVLAGAAALGADAVVIVARGEEDMPGQPFYSRDVIRAKALRVEHRSLER